jgi:hypothetical protein
MNCAKLWAMNDEFCKMSSESKQKIERNCAENRILSDIAWNIFKCFPAVVEFERTNSNK